MVTPHTFHSLRYEFIGIDLGSPVIFGAKACQKVEVSEAYPAYRPGAKVTHVPGPGRVDEGSS